MEKQSDDILLKPRSSRACIGAGYRLFSSNFRRIFRQTWWTALLYAVLSGIYTSYLVTVYPKILLASLTGQGLPPDATGNIAIMSLGSLFIMAVSLLLYAQLFALLCHHREDGSIPYPERLFSPLNKKVFLHTLVWGIFWLVLTMVIYLVVGGIAVFSTMKHSLTGMGIAAIFSLTTTLLLIPLTYPAMNYLTSSKKSFLPVLSKGYRDGLRHWGFLFVIALVTVIVSVFALMLTTLPATILTIANIKAQSGILIGDPLGMPSYIGKLTLMVFTIAGFIQAYIILSIFFPAYYASGSIETQEQERNETKITLH